jgi:putative choline sulfate-utilization transcription factor
LNSVFRTEIKVVFQSKVEVFPCLLENSGSFPREGKTERHLTSVNRLFLMSSAPSQVWQTLHPDEGPSGGQVSHPLQPRFGVNRIANWSPSVTTGITTEGLPIAPGRHRLGPWPLRHCREIRPTQSAFVSGRPSRKGRTLRENRPGARGESKSVRKYPLPSLDLLRTFEAVARHRSFTLAADELCLTQSAVSRQIKSLEDALGLDLFLRLHRAIDLTAEGQRLLESVTHGLDDISACLAALGAASKAPQITVCASVAFAWFWLMPRLERFGALQPDVDLRVLATDQPVLPGTGEVDVAILFGSGRWEGLEARLLFGEEVYPVCSPAYLRAHPALHRPEDLLDQTLLHLEYGKPSLGGVDWRTWLLRQGVNGQPVRRGLRFNSYPMVMQAAEAGHGVALGWSYVTDPLLAEGRLVCPVDRRLETQDGYYLCTSVMAAKTAGITAFLKWISMEAAGQGDLHITNGNAMHSE